MSPDEPAGPQDKSDQVRCKRCDAVPRLVHKIPNVRTGGSLHVQVPISCACGTNTRWDS